MAVASVAAAHPGAGDMMRKILIVLFLLGLLATQALGANDDGLIPVPPLKERVTDLTDTLSSEEKGALTEKLKNFEKASGSQIAVLIIPTTKPEEIEQYSIRVVEQWKLGRKGIADGILLIIAKDDHKMKIEVGRGLEGAIPDAIAKRIISEIISPQFKEGNFYGGIDAGVDKMIGIIGGEMLPEPTQGLNKDDMEAIIIILLFFGFLVVLFGIWAFAASKMQTAGNKRKRGRQDNDNDGWSNDSRDSGWSSSNSNSSSSDSSDSFSGGGGDFGGGGASGDW